MIYASQVVHMIDATHGRDIAPNWTETNSSVLTCFGRSPEDAQKHGDAAADLWDANTHEHVIALTPEKAPGMRCDFCDGEGKDLFPAPSDFEFGIDHEVMTTVACAECLVTEELIEADAAERQGA